MAYRLALARGLQKCVENLLNGADTRDYTVVVEGISCRCHRFILSTCSGFFQNLFKSDMRERYENTVTLYGVSFSTFDIIISALYKGSLGISEDNVLDVWATTHYLQIGYITEDCYAFIKLKMSVDNCFITLKHATMYTAQTMVDASLDFISKHFDEFRHHDNLLQLPFDYFYKVIANDCLRIDSEELVVQTVLQWVAYTPPYGQETFPQIKENMENADLYAFVPFQHIFIKRNVRNEEGERGNRKQHLAELLSACRLLTITSNTLDTLLKKYTRVFDTGVFQLMHEAVMYASHVSRRHDAWPEAAVHRANSPHKHVMVFLSYDALMAYNLDTGLITEFAKLPAGVSISTDFTIFDNTLLLLSRSYDKSFTHTIDKMYMLSANKIWTYITRIVDATSFILQPHGEYVYYCCLHGTLYPHNNRLDRFSFFLGRVSNCCQLPDCGDCLVRFHQYIIVFATKNFVITAQCYNTDTEQTHTCNTAMSGTSQDMVSFKHRDDVYILQSDGSLWKVFSTDTTPVNFKLVSILWDFDYIIKGCVLFKQTLFVFCTDTYNRYEWTSLPNVFTKVRIIDIKTEKPCVPMIIKEKQLA